MQILLYRISKNYNSKIKFNYHFNILIAFYSFSIGAKAYKVNSDLVENL